ncbi:hypothetical protein HX867_24540 [Pseudomonas gingeri]|uniref:nSTAND3 domain-containing NTPase n=1 Tax=Pseudomonas gingeri TaxID=117681 RepID=UPI0015A228AD|nr:hypothetical protein [Pseudomonas gingeri]NVZ65275.1 hypothetical protein [Pseudomonas gingeri]NVZ74130.1 hypothetical protein [Pseudomonas gingeri]
MDDYNDRGAQGGDGNPAFHGFIYQKKVTVWIALQLLLNRVDGCNEIIVEPVSQEDVEACIDDEESTVSIGGVHKLLIQIKNRGKGYWTASAFSELVKDRVARSASGPGTRPRGKALLLEDPSRRYIFITNCSVAGELAAAELKNVDEALDPSFLPPKLTEIEAEQLALTGRWGLIQNLTENDLRARIHDLLESRGKVPISNLPAAIDKLERLVERRMAGLVEPLTRDHVRDVITSEGGGAVRDQELREFIAPPALARAESLLDTLHAVMLIGPPGYGKSLIAKNMVHALRERSRPYEVVRESAGLAAIEHYLAQRGLYVFHLDDPWGQSKLEADADKWVIQLPRLLARASADKLFIITSRTDILRQSRVGEDEEPWRSLTCEVSDSDYGDDVKWNILEKKLEQAQAWMLPFAERYRSGLLQVLQSPLAIDRFCKSLLACGDESVALIEQLVDQAQVSSIRQIVRQQVLGWPERGVECATVIWAMIRRNQRISFEGLSTIRRALDDLSPPLSIDLERFVQHFLISTLDEDEKEEIGAHGKVIEAFEEVITDSPAVLERTLGRCVEALYAQWCDDPACLNALINLLEAISSLWPQKLRLNRVQQDKVDEFLRKCIATTDDFQFDYYFERVIRWGSERCAIARFLRDLTAFKPVASGREVKYWSAPALSPEFRRVLERDPLIPRLLSSWIRYRFVDASVVYDGPQLFTWLAGLGGDLGEAWAQSCNWAAPAGRNQPNALALFQCAALADAFHYDDEMFSLIEGIEDGLREHRYEVGDYQEQSFQGIDDASIELLFKNMLDDDQELIHRLTMAYVQMRRRNEGYQWIEDHPRHDLILPAWSMILGEQSLQVAALERESLELLNRAYDQSLILADHDLEGICEDLDIPDIDDFLQLEPMKIVEELLSVETRRSGDPHHLIEQMYYLENLEIAKALREAVGRMDAMSVRKHLPSLMEHDHADVRRHAVSFFAGLVEPLGLNRYWLYNGASDKSAHVRLELAKVIGHFKWQDGVECLISLLSDCRDYQADEGGPRFEVARAAARALSGMHNLSEEHRQAIRTFLSQPPRDPQDPVVNDLLSRSFPRSAWECSP